MDHPLLSQIDNKYGLQKTVCQNKKCNVISATMCVVEYSISTIIFANHTRKAFFLNYISYLIAQQVLFYHIHFNSKFLLCIIQNFG